MKCEAKPDPLPHKGRGPPDTLGTVKADANARLGEDIIRPGGRHKTFEVDTNRQSNWKIIMDSKPEGQDAALEAMLPGMKLLIVIDDTGIHCPRRLAGILLRKQVETLGILVLREHNKPVFPAAVELVDSLPGK